MPTTTEAIPPEEVLVYYKGKMIPRAEADRRRAAEHAPAPALIPHQLQGCRFVLVRDRDKRAFEKGWNDKQNYTHDSERLARHIAAETNYGVMVSGGLCVLDCDNVIALYDDPLFSTLMQTFIVKTGRKGALGAHFYFYCPELPPEKSVLVREDGTDVGDLRGSDSKFYVVGPGSRHPSGNSYTVNNDVEPLAVPLADVEAFISRYQAKPKAVSIPHFTSAGTTIADKLDLRVSDLLMPEEPRNREHQIEGIHPVHGSSTGSNLIIDPQANTWYCRRHGTGGGPLEALAVADGIIECEESRSGCLQGHWPAVFEALKKRGYTPQLAEMEREKQTKACAPHVQVTAPVTTAEPQADLKKQPEVMHDSAGEGYALTDAGNSDRLVHQYGADLRHCQTFSAWYTWSGKVWERDITNRMLDYATRVARSIMVECAYINDPKKSQDCGKWALTSQSMARRNAMIEGATYQVAVTPEVWDRPENLLNCQNGTLELDTMTFREHRREDLLTKCCSVNFDPGASCPQWEEHIRMVLADDDDLIRGFQEVCGYSLIAMNPEQVLFILYGTGKNGKNVTMDTLSYVLGDYATHIAAESLMVKRGEAPRSDLARLAGARMVTASEPAENAALAESVIKQLTGDAKVTVRRLYENEFEFEPGGKIWLATNYQPRIMGTDEGIWRRIWLLPFTYTIPADKRKLGYEVVLQEEATGILNWCLKGYTRWRSQGLVQPAAVRIATETYRSEADSVASWFSSKIMVDPPRYLTRKIVRESYERWCEEAGERPVSSRKLAMELRARGLDNGPVVNGVRSWIGIRWKTVDEQEAGL